MTKPKILVTRLIPERGLEMLRQEVNVEVWPDPLPPPYETLVQKVTGIDALLCMLTDKIDETVMNAIGPQLKVISQMAVGFDNIDVPAATRRGIPIGNTPGVLTDSTADFAWALLTAAARRVVESDKFTRAGKWKTWGPMDFLGPDITGERADISPLTRVSRLWWASVRGRV